MFGVLGVIGDDVRSSSGSCRASHDDDDSPPSIDRELQKHTKAHLDLLCPLKFCISVWKWKRSFLIREDVQETDLRNMS